MKIDESVCDNVIMIIYPVDEEKWSKILNLFEQKRKSWDNNYTILIILDPYFIDHHDRLEGHLFTPKDHRILKATIKKNSDTGNLYAFY